MKAVILVLVVALGQPILAANKKPLIADPIVEKAIRTSLKKPVGELTKANLERVTGLDLYRANISDVGLKELAKCKKLEGLSLDSTQISDAGLKGLAKLTQLKGLRVQQTKVTKAGVAQLQKALPECHIVSDADK